MTGNIKLCNRISPCKDCTSRAVGCHSACEKYAEFRAERESEYIEREKIRNNNDAMRCVRTKGGT